MISNKKVLLVDLDGVLNDYTGNIDKNFIPPMKKNAKKFLANLSNNYAIKIYTTRNHLLVSKWLIENELDEYVTDVTNMKELAYLYIDDRCICFNGSFEKLQKEIEKFQVYWKI